MKKYLIPSVMIILVAGGLSFAYVILRQDRDIPEQSTKDSISALLMDKYDRPADTVEIAVTVDTGIFAKGTYHEAGAGGGLWFAVKTTEGWVLAYDGNGIVPCDDIDPYDFPRDMIPQCIDTSNGNTLIQR